MPQSLCCDIAGINWPLWNPEPRNVHIKWLYFQVHLKIFFMIHSRMPQSKWWLFPCCLVGEMLLPAPDDFCGWGCPGTFPSCLGAEAEAPARLVSFWWEGAPWLQVLRDTPPPPSPHQSTYCLWLGGQSVELGVVSVPQPGFSRDQRGHFGFLFSFSFFPSYPSSYSIALTAHLFYSTSEWV